MKNLGKIRFWLAGHCNSSRTNCNAILAGCPSLECVGESDLSNNALTQIEAAQPDIVIWEIDAHDRRTSRILKRFATSMPSTHIIAYGPTDDKRFVMKLLRNGVRGYLSKSAVATELKPAIVVVMQGDVFLCPAASGALLNEYRKHARSRKLGYSTNHKLTHIHNERGQ